MTKNLKTLIHRLTGVLCLCAMLFSAGIFASCTENKDEVEEFTNWKSTNDTYWQKLYTATEQKIKAGDTSWKLILNYTLQGQQANSGATLSYRPEDYIIVHVEETGTGTVTPIYSDSVAVHYKGQLIPSTTYTAGLIFDKSWSRDVFDASTSRPAHLHVGSVVDGFATALQQMHKGDHWTIYIPYQLGYGSSKTGSVPAYSTLIFDLRLVGIAHVGQKLKI